MSNALEIKKSILEIGKAKITFKASSKNYLFNGKAPREIPKDYYTQLHLSFRNKLFIQLKDNCTAELLNKYINYTKSEIENLKVASDNHRVDYVFSKSKNELSDEAESTHEDIMSILATQNSVLLKIQLKLEEELEFVGFKTTADYQEEIVKQIPDLDTTTIPFGDSGRATFKMSKKESLMLIYILEKTNLIEFDGADQRRRFIENNFNFTEVRKNKDEGKSFPMIGISSEISKFKSLDRDELKSNNKTLTTLLERLNETIHLFEFKK